MHAASISYTAVFMASLIGSVHCMGMCGGFAGFCAGSGSRFSLPLLLYHGGRLLSYAILGAVAGLVGQSIDRSAILLGVQHAAAIGAAVLLIIWGLGSFFRFPIPSLGTVSAVLPVQKLAAPLRWIHSPGAWHMKTTALGALSGLLPCGWLYMYVAVAAGTASPFYGALSMVFFWAGTVPALTLVGGFSKIALGRLQPYVPRLVGGMLFLAGMYSLGIHLFSAMPAAPSSCH